MNARRFATLNTMSEGDGSVLLGAQLPPRAASRLDTPKTHRDASCHEKVAFSTYTEVICITELVRKFPGVPDPVPLITNFQTAA